MAPTLGVTCALATLGAAGIGLRDHIPDLLSIWAANVAMIASLGVFCVSLLRFDNRPAPWWIAAACPVVWTLACLIPSFYGSLQARITLNSLSAIVYCLIAAWSLYAGRRLEPLPSRAFAVVVIAMHAIGQAGRIVMINLDPLTFVPGDNLGTWGTILVLEGLAFLVGLTVTIPALDRERAELRHRRDAATDSLTGIANRRSFIARASEAVDGSMTPATLLLLDLDHFKRVNDTYGHAVGDRALVAFADLLRAHLPERSIYGRIGGEEFACLISGADIEAGRALAERIRTSVADLRLRAADRFVTISVSVGIATTKDCGPRFDRLMAAGDDAMYVAKRSGRNRCHCYGEPHDLPDAA